MARYRIRAGRRIGSAALMADGYHARTDGLTSLAVLISAGGAWLGVHQLDPVVGLVITVAILFVLKDPAVQVWHRLMDAVDPKLVAQLEAAARSVEGGEGGFERTAALDPSIRSRTRTAFCSSVRIQTSPEGPCLPVGGFSVAGSGISLATSEQAARASADNGHVQVAPSSMTPVAEICWRLRWPPRRRPFC